MGRERLEVGEWGEKKWGEKTEERKLGGECEGGGGEWLCSSKNSSKKPRSCTLANFYAYRRPCWSLSDDDWYACRWNGSIVGSVDVHTDIQVYSAVWSSGSQYEALRETVGSTKLTNCRRHEIWTWTSHQHSSQIQVTTYRVGQKSEPQMLYT